MIDFSPLIISMQVAVSATIISSLVGIALSYMLFKYPKHKGWTDTLLTLPMVLPPTVIGLILLVLLGNSSGIGKLLEALGMPVVFTVKGAVIAASVVGLPLFFKTVGAAIETIDQDMLGVARTLGMTEYKIFRIIVIPQIYPALLSGVILAFTRALGEFGATLMLAGNIPGKTQTMSIAIYTAIQSGNKQVAYTWGILMAIFSLVSIWGMKKWIQRKW